MFTGQGNQSVQRDVRPIKGFTNISPEDDLGSIVSEHTAAKLRGECALQTGQALLRSIRGMLCKGAQYSILRRSGMYPLQEALDYIHTHFDNGVVGISRDLEVITLSDLEGSGEQRYKNLADRFIEQADDELLRCGVQLPRVREITLSDMHATICGALSGFQAHAARVALRRCGSSGCAWHLDDRSNTAENYKLARVLGNYRGAGPWYAKVPLERIDSEYVTLSRLTQANEWGVPLALVAEAYFRKGIMWPTRYSPRPFAGEGYLYRNMYEVEKSYAGDIGVHLLRTGEDTPGAVHSVPAVLKSETRLQLFIDLSFRKADIC